MKLRILPMDREKRKELILLKSKIRPIVLKTESHVPGVSKSGESRSGDGKNYQNIKKDNEKHTNDALMGEVVIKQN